MNGQRPPPATTSVVLLLVAAGKMLARRVDDELATLGLTLRHLGALGHLAHAADLSYSDLARRAGITTQSMHATVRALEERGAVRRRLAGQGHPARLEITDPGRDLLDTCRATLHRLDRELLDGLPADERDALWATLLAVAAPPAVRGPRPPPPPPGR